MPVGEECCDGGDVRRGEEDAQVGVESLVGVPCSEIA